MTKVQSLDQLAKMFAKEYVVVSLKFVRSHLLHSKQSEKNAKSLLRKAGFVRGATVSLKDPANASGYTWALCYWRKDYFGGKAPDKHTLQKLADKQLVALPSEIGTEQDPVSEAAEHSRPSLCDAMHPEEAAKTSLWEIPANPVDVCLFFDRMLEENIKTYLRTLPPGYQRAFCYLYESAFQDLQGNCTLTDFDGTTHVFGTVPLSEDARRYYAALINMFYQEEAFWGRMIIWLEHNSKFSGESWKPLLQHPYSEALQHSYFYLTDLRQLHKDNFSMLQAGLGLC